LRRILAVEMATTAIPAANNRALVGSGTAAAGVEFDTHVPFSQEYPTAHMTLMHGSPGCAHTAVATSATPSVANADVRYLIFRYFIFHIPPSVAIDLLVISPIR